jgi:chromosomal replication initiator protein
MGNTQDATRATDVADRVRAVLERRIGADRYAVWFGRSFAVHVEAGPPVARRRRRTAAGAGPTAVTTPDPVGGGDRVVLRVGVGLTHEWLRRTFRVDVEHAVREVCGSAVEVVWEAAAPADETDTAPEVAASPPAAASPAERPRGGGRSRRPRVPGRGEAAVAGGAGGSQAAEPRAGRGLGDGGGRGLGEFVVGPSNRLACGAVELAASRPGDVSPLVIHGPSGVGKTHLLDVACQRLRAAQPGAVVVSLSAEQFTNGFLQALHGSGLPGFRRTCRSADLLVIDDIQFLVGKRATLLEFQLTVDALHRQGRQMVFACDRELDALSGLGPDLLTRLRGGMNAPVLAPDYEVRRGIVAALCARRSLEVPDEVVHYVATHMTRHARELIGAVNRLEATSLMLGVAVTAGMAEEALADLVRSSGRSVRLADVERAVCTAFGIEPGSLQSSRRARTVSQPRMLAMFLARKHTHAALTDIGRYFGRRSHSTVIAAQKTVGAWVAGRAPVVLAETEWDVEEAIRRVEDLLRAG